MLSMSVYAPTAQNGDALDAPALSFGGVKRWFVQKNLKELARIFHAIRFFHPARYTIHSVDQNPPNFHTLQHVVPLF
jgi:hypothetical protein